jgi:predicted ester cyclase
VYFYLAAFPDTKFTIEDLIAEGDKVVVRWSVQGTHTGPLGDIAPTGRRVSITGTTTCRIAGGMIVEAHDNWDALGMRQQLGVLPARTGQASA